MNNVSYFGGIRLGRPGITPLTWTMLVAAITGFVEETRKTRINTSYPPRLLDQHALVNPILRREPVHAPIEDTIYEPVLGKEALHTFLLPVPIVPRPFKEDSRTKRNGMFGDLLECSPELPKETIMPLDFLDSFYTPHGNVKELQHRATRTRSRIPQRVEGAGDRQLGFLYTFAGSEIIKLRDVNHRAVLVMPVPLVQHIVIVTACLNQSAGRSGRRIESKSQPNQMRAVVL